MNFIIEKALDYIDGYSNLYEAREGFPSHLSGCIKDIAPTELNSFLEQLKNEIDKLKKNHTEKCSNENCQEIKTYDFLIYTVNTKAKILQDEETKNNKPIINLTQNIMNKTENNQNFNNNTITNSKISDVNSIAKKNRPLIELWKSIKSFFGF